MSDVIQSFTLPSRSLGSTISLSGIAGTPTQQSEGPAINLSTQQPTIGRDSRYGNWFFQPTLVEIARQCRNIELSKVHAIARASQHIISLERLDQSERDQLFEGFLENIRAESIGEERSSRSGQVVANLVQDLLARQAGTSRSAREGDGSDDEEERTCREARDARSDSGREGDTKLGKRVREEDFPWFASVQRSKEFLSENMRKS